MRERYDIRVIATDGKAIKKIVWIKRTRNHIVYGWDMYGDAGHFTYHKSGRLHYKNKKETHGMGQRISLDQFEGRLQLGNMCICKDISSGHNVDFDFKKVDGLVYVDIRTLNKSRNVFNIDLQLVKKDGIDQVYQLPGYDTIHIFKFSNPWVVISIG